MFRLNMYQRRLLMTILMLTTLYAVSQILWKSNYFDYDRKSIADSMEESIRANKIQGKCKHPDLPVNAPEIMQFIHDVPPIDCSSVQNDWVVCNVSKCSITQTALTKHGEITCEFKDLVRISDRKDAIEEAVSTKDSYILKRSDVVNVSCRSINGDSWGRVLTGIRQDEKIHSTTGWSYLPNGAIKLNVLMFGFDSLSKNTFIRKLPKSYEVLTQILKADVLQGYNIVGDGTPQALIPILTGKTELELPDTRKRMGSQAQFVNVYPFIWNDFKKAGYATGFFEDVPDIGTFTYRLKGFLEQPTDHYMRTFYRAAQQEYHRYPKLCLGPQPRHKVMMDLTTQFMNAYSDKPRFIFSFHGELSHDSYNLVGVVDDDLSDWLLNLKKSGILDNTLLIMMSDHGHRFAAIRNTLQGKQEERMPFFSFTLPETFKKEYPELYKNLKKNVEHLTTPFDIYSTLKTILEPHNLNADLTQRSLSLFGEIPEERSCSDAYIEPHWCACMNWQPINVTDKGIKNAADALVKLLNSYTYKHRDICEQLYLDSISWGAKLSAQDNLLRFHHSKDSDGFVPDLGATTKITSELYQIKVILKPGNSIFEASVYHDLDLDSYSVKLSDVSRVNMYGRQARCVEKDLHHLRKYCYCRDDL